MTEIYDGTELKYLIENTGVKEERYVNQFIDKLQIDGFLIYLG